MRPDGSEGPVEGEVQHDRDHGGQNTGRWRARGGEVDLVVVGGSEDFLGEPGPIFADPGEFAASAAGDGEVLARQVAGRPADDLAVAVEQGVSAPGIPR